MKYSEVERKLKAQGCRWCKNGTRHPVWYSPITNDFFLLSYHGNEEVAKGTLKEISKKSGIKL
ncbi:MAG: type II toxin-antitoxin system HicA family toxin [Oscillospiraceae bacterium]|jgi:predicted RNA binding protein YcfA (HicA-like mRNA interferase family)|nr:type II toxin-antitoxin system HicA family toxin [Oscillospiraceae bacterium]